MENCKLAKEYKPKNCLNSVRKIPKKHIEFIINRMHLSAPNSYIRSDFEKRAKGKDFPKGYLNKCIAYAIAHHNKNAKFYSNLMRGI